MRKQPSDYPRFVTYFTEAEAARIKQRAAKANLSTPQKWIVAVVRKVLSKQEDRVE